MTRLIARSNNTPGIVIKMKHPVFSMRRFGHMVPR